MAKWNLAEVQARNKAWRDRYLPAIRERNERVRDERERATALFNLWTGGLPEGEAALVRRVFLGL